MGGSAVQPGARSEQAAYGKAAKDRALRHFTCQNVTDVADDLGRIQARLLTKPGLSLASVIEGNRAVAAPAKFR